MAHSASVSTTQLVDGFLLIAVSQWQSLLQFCAHFFHLLPPPHPATSHWFAMIRSVTLLWVESSTVLYWLYSQVELLTKLRDEGFRVIPKHARCMYLHVVETKLTNPMPKPRNGLGLWWWDSSESSSIATSVLKRYICFRILSWTRDCRWGSASLRVTTWGFPRTSQWKHYIRLRLKAARRPQCRFKHEPGTVK